IACSAPCDDDLSRIARLMQCAPTARDPHGRPPRLALPLRHGRSQGRCRPTNARGPARQMSANREDLMPASLLVSACLATPPAALLLFPPGPRVAAQPAGLYINSVDLDINPADMDAYMAALKENGAKAVTEPGCREFNIHVKADNPNHV